MLLAVDIGNSNIVMGAFEGSNATARWRIKTDPDRTADEYAVILSSLCAMRGIALNAFDDVIIGSVVPPLTATFQVLVDRYLSARPFVVVPGIKTGIKLLVDNPREVGADRIANTLAAYQRYGGPAIVIDMGTATTFDAVSNEGDFLGGAIAPGLEISMDALFERAARLYRVDLARPRTAIGKNTMSNVQSGGVFGYTGLIEGMVRRFKLEHGPCKVIGTGGLIGLIAHETDVIDIVDEDLTLDGLRMLWEINQ